MADSTHMSSLVGRTIRGKYRIDAPLGSGGMGVVLRARHLKLEQDVALKLLRADARTKPAIVARFAREARAAARLKSDHVVRILDVDEDDDGTPFFVMEYLRGQDLEHVLRGGPLEPARAVDLLLQACEAVAEAHALGMVHRDLKPANLFVVRGRDGRENVKLLDFGITKEEASEDVSLTSAAAIVGSPLYMSPEQLKSSRDVDARTDIWALGVVLYQLLTAAMPFEGTNAGELGAQIASEPPRPILERRPELDPVLADAIERCLAKNRDDRFASAADLALAIAPFAPEGAAGASSRVLRVVRSAPIEDPALRETQPGEHRAATPARPMRVTESIAADASSSAEAGAVSDDLAKTTGSPNVRSVPPPPAQAAAPPSTDTGSATSNGRRAGIAAAIAVAIVVGAFFVRSLPTTLAPGTERDAAGTAPSAPPPLASTTLVPSTASADPIVPAPRALDAAAPAQTASTAAVKAHPQSSASATKPAPAASGTTKPGPAASSSPTSPLDIDLK